MFFLIIIVGLPVLGVLWWVWADRMLRSVRHARWWRARLGVWAGMMLGGFLWVILARRMGVVAMPPVAVLSMVYIWHLLVMPSMVGVAVIAGAVVGVRKMVKVARKRGEQAPAEAAVESVGVSRRELLGAAVAGIPPLVTAGMAGVGLSQLDEFRVREMDVAVAGLPPVLEGMTIAHVSDVHVGKYTKGRVLEEIVEKTNGLKADLVLMSGDLIDWSMSDLPKALEMVKALRSGSGLGAYMCEGNHDLFDDRLGFERGVKNAGVPLLLNESEMVSVRGQRVQLLGIKWGGISADRRYPAMNEHVEAVSRLRRRDAFPILLAHHPHTFDAAAARGIPLTLAGHTHGGQLMLTGELGAGPMLFRYWSGLYRKEGAALVVSNGVGNWFPLRIGAPAEILHLKLVRA